MALCYTWVILLGGLMKNVKIYVMAHKKFDEPEDKIYIPLQVGAAKSASLGYVPDNTGVNISEKNPYYSELTGLYWMWKNGEACDITGLCHYRRYFLDEKDQLLKSEDYESILARYDIIVTDKITYDSDADVYARYGERHYVKDLDLVRNAIKECYPEYLKDYDAVIHGYEMYYANMMVTTKERLDQYAKWLFDILFHVEKHIDMTGYDDYDKRVYGFLSERLVMVWVRHNRLKVYEANVGLVGVKSETVEALEESKKILLTGDADGVIAYLQEISAKRPDLFYLDSDTNKDLATIYALAEIAALENRLGKHNLMDYSLQYAELRKLYDDLKDEIHCWNTYGDLYGFIKNHKLSKECVMVVIGKEDLSKNEQILIYNYLANAYLNDGDINSARLFVELALKEG